MSRLRQILVHNDGFAFDPTTGESFTCNSTAAFIINLLKSEKSPQEVSLELADAFDVTGQDADHDVFDFIYHLRILNIIE